MSIENNLSGFVEGSLLECLNKTPMDSDAVLSDLLHLRYKPKRESFKLCDPCPAFRCFDWVIWLPDSWSVCRFSRWSPRSVLCLAHPDSVALVSLLSLRLRDATVVFAGEDTHLSAMLPRLEGIARRARKVYYEAKDVEHATIESFCMGFNCFYLKRVPGSLLRELTTKVAGKHWVKSGVFAAWGAIWAWLDEEIEDRRAAMAFLKSCQWITREHLDPAQYWRRLAESEFLLAPAGQGIQAPKLAEAWLMRTVPIVTVNPCFSDLHKAGFPMLILESWSELSEKRLEDYRRKVKGIDWARVQSMLTVSHFRSRYLNH